jgi:hypothetical protein
MRCLLRVAMFVSFVLGAAPERAIDPAFAPVIEDLRSKVAIPLRLPTVLPDLGQGTDRVYTIVQRAESSSYSVLLAFTPDCNGASVCRIGTLSGAKASRQRVHGKAVHLKKGITGRYTESNCGANCSDAVVSWREGANAYAARVKAGRRDDAVALANSTLAP